MIRKLDVILMNEADAVFGKLFLKYTKPGTASRIINEL
jgi:hypothetical protein